MNIATIKITDKGKNKESVTHNSAAIFEPLNEII